VTLLFILGLALTAVAVTLVARSIITARLRSAETLAQIGHYGFAGSLEDERPHGLRSLLDDIAAGIGTIVVGRLKLFNEDQVRKQLVSAGMYGTTPRMIFGYQVIVALAAPAFWIWISVAAGFSGALAILGVVVAGAVGWLTPTTVVGNRATTRVGQIDYAMPELIDLLVVTVEAGLSLNAALQLASERMKGPLGDELRITLQEQRMGLQPAQAFESMLVRCPTDAVRSFVRAMIQGERLGVSVGQILRSLALEMRKRRRAAAEERAQKAPIKILFPLGFMIFPAMFVVILGPAVINIFNALKT
jgi:tight adherence protein C